MLRKLYILKKCQTWKENLIINICSEKITKEELENLISRKLKTFTKKHVKHLSYEDVYNIILTAVDDN